MLMHPQSASATHLLPSYHHLERMRDDGRRRRRRVLHAPQAVVDDGGHARDGDKVIMRHAKRIRMRISTRPDISPALAACPSPQIAAAAPAHTGNVGQRVRIPSFPIRSSATLRIASYAQGPACGSRVTPTHEAAVEPRAWRAMDSDFGKDPGRLTAERVALSARVRGRHTLPSLITLQEFLTRHKNRSFRCLSNPSYMAVYRAPAAPVVPVRVFDRDLEPDRCVCNLKFENVRTRSLS
jgi:hypothetical protein